MSGRKRASRGRGSGSAVGFPEIDVARNMSLVATRVYEGGDVAEAQQRARDGRQQARSRAARADGAAGALRRELEQRVALVFSSHGGTGATTLVTTLATTLARQGRAVCVLDLDLQFGDVLNALNLKATCPISDAMAGEGRLDGDDLRQRLPQHETGVAVLSQVGFVEELAQLSKKRFPAFVGRVRRHFDVLLVDGVRDFNDYAIAVLDVADDLVMVTTQDVLALRGLAMRLEVLVRLGLRPADVTLVLNRFSGNSRLPLSAIVESLPLEPRYIVRDDFKAVHGALQQGRALIDHAPRSRAVRDLVALAEGLFGSGPDRGDQPAAGLLGRLLGGKRP